MTGTISFHEQLGNREHNEKYYSYYTNTRIFLITVLCHNFTVSSAKLQRCKS